MKNWTITDIENIAETEVKEMSLETMVLWRICSWET